MTTSYSTCYACPLRRVDGKQCAKLKAMSIAIRGLAIKKIDFHREDRDSLFQPGQRVWYKFTANYGDGVKTVTGQAWVWKRVGNKIRVCRSDADANGMSPIIKLFPNQLERMDGGERRVCLRCGKPEGIASKIRQRDGEPYDYVCTTTWSQLSDTYGEAEPETASFQGRMDPNPPMKLNAEYSAKRTRSGVTHDGPDPRLHAGDRRGAVAGGRVP